MRWVGIDEAGYGPNLGPLVMTAVVAEGPGPCRPDLWADCALDRAGGRPDRLWLDDSKRLHTPGRPPVRLEATALAAVGPGVPASVADLLATVEAGTAESTEWDQWWGESGPAALPRFIAPVELAAVAGRSPMRCAGWSLAAVRCVVLGPARFNEGLAASASKADVHFSAFAHLLRGVWDALGENGEADVHGDKHGGRHFYAGPLASAFPDAWIERGDEGPAASRYALRRKGRRLCLELSPRADDADGLVALASIISKYVRELWMQDFNAFWAARLPGLAPTAGYPVDAARFRRAIEAEARSLGLEPSGWWRER